MKKINTLKLSEKIIYKNNDKSNRKNGQKKFMENELDGLQEYNFSKDRFQLK